MLDVWNLDKINETMVRHLEPHRTVMGHQRAGASLPGPFCKFQQVSRYVSYCDSSIAIRIVS